MLLPPGSVAHPVRQRHLPSSEILRRVSAAGSDQALGESRRWIPGNSDRGISRLVTNSHPEDGYAQRCCLRYTLNTMVWANRPKLGTASLATQCRLSNPV